MAVGQEHLTAESGTELRNWGYPKVANAGALPTLTAADVGTIYTTSDNNINYELVESDGVDAKWRPTTDHVDSNGDVWEYRVDTNGNPHRWYGRQPPVSLAGGAGQDILAAVGFQVPQTDFSFEFLTVAGDYSLGNQGMGGQFINAGSQRAWGVRFDGNGRIRAFGSADGITTPSANTTRDVYSAGIIDGDKVRVRADYRFIAGPSIEVDIWVWRQPFDITGHTVARDWILLGTIPLPVTGLLNAVIQPHLGSRFRSGTAAVNGGDGIAGIVEGASLTIGGAVQWRFPHPVGAEGWTHTGADLVNPSPFLDRGASLCTQSAGGLTGQPSGAFVDGCETPAMPATGVPDATYDPTTFPELWRQTFSGGVSGTEVWMVRRHAGGTNEWVQIG